LLFASTLQYNIFFIISRFCKQHHTQYKIQQKSVKS
jgi:hypothetical protein